MGTGSSEVQSTNERLASIPLKRPPGYWARFRLPYVHTPFPSPLSPQGSWITPDQPREAGTNLEYWVAELDQRIEGILLQRLTHIIQVWCATFDRLDDSDTRRDLLPVRDVASKRRGNKRMKKVRFSFVFCCE